MIRKFENFSNTKFAVVDFTGGGDGVHALYINGKLHKYGDYYHDKIEVWIESFIEGVEWTGFVIDVDRIECTNEDLIEKIKHLGDSPPENLEDID